MFKICKRFKDESTVEPINKKLDPLYEKPYFSSDAMSEGYDGEINHFKF